MAKVAAEHGFTITRPYGMAYIPEFGVYTYAVRGSNDIRGEGWDTSLWIDGNTGALRDVSLPSGQHAGNTVSTVLWGLHYGDIRNFLPYRILVAFFGLVLTVISVTGVYIWWKKRKGRMLAASRRPQAGNVVAAVLLTLAASATLRSRPWAKEPSEHQILVHFSPTNLNLEEIIR